MNNYEDLDITISFNTDEVAIKNFERLMIRLFIEKQVSEISLEGGDEEIDGIRL